MRDERNKYDYVDVTVNGVTVSILRDNPEAIGRVLLGGVEAAPEPSRDSFASGSIVARVVPYDLD